MANNNLRVGDYLQIEVEGSDWRTFRVWEITQNVDAKTQDAEVVCVEDIDFTETVEISNGKLPMDVRLPPPDFVVPPENGCVLWAWCVCHLNGSTRLRNIALAPVSLPGPQGPYTVTEEKIRNSTSFVWVKRVWSPAYTQPFRSLPKIAKHAFANEPVLLNAALASLKGEATQIPVDVTDEGVIGEPPAVPPVQEPYAQPSAQPLAANAPAATHMELQAAPMQGLTEHPVAPVSPLTRTILPMA
jgi:hypothetical protein